MAKHERGWTWDEYDMLIGAVDCAIINNERATYPDKKYIKGLRSISKRLKDQRDGKD